MQLDDLPTPERETTVAPDELHVDGDNPNEQDEATFGLLCDRLRENGWLGGPIVTDTDGCIADGEHRWRAAQEIGLTEVPVKQYDIDDATRRLWRQELNKITGEHDPKRDALEYEHLLDTGHADAVQELTNAADEDLDELLAELQADPGSAPTYEYDTTHQVYYEDCLEGLPDRLDADAVDCVVTDPPWGIDFDSGFSERFDPIENDDTLEWLPPLADELARVAAPGAHLYVFTGWSTMGAFIEALEAAGIEVVNQLIWVKSKSRATGGHGAYRTHHENILFCRQPGDDPRHVPTDGAWTVLDDYPGELGDRMVHPNQKPVGLIWHLMRRSTDPGDLVLDPFMGSGTTAVTAILNHRDYVGFELDEEAFGEVVDRRISEAQRQVASAHPAVDT